MPQVRVTLLPYPIEVPDDEVPVLRAQGILVEEPAPAAEPTIAAAKATAPRKEGQS